MFVLLLGCQRKEGEIMTMAQRIRDCRKSNKLTQKELAEKLGVKEAAVSKWESGIVENIPRTTIKAMAELFGVGPCYLMAFSNDPAPTENSVSIYDRVTIELGSKASELLKEFAIMNEHGQELALTMVRSLVYDPANTEKEKKHMKQA